MWVGFWQELLIELGWFPILFVFLEIFTPKIAQTYQNFAFFIIDHNCLTSFIGNYHKHGYSKKSSHISGWVPDFWAKRHFTYREPPLRKLYKKQYKNTSVGVKISSLRKSLLCRNPPRLCIINLNKNCPIVTETIILISKSQCRVIHYSALPCITRRKNYQIFLIHEKPSNPCHYSTFPCISRHKKRIFISPRAVNCAGFRYSVLK